MVGEGSDFSWLLSNITKWGLAQMWVKAILGDLIPRHLLHSELGAGLFRGRAEEAARPCPLAVPLFWEFHFQDLWHEDLFKRPVLASAWVRAAEGKDGGGGNPSTDALFLHKEGRRGVF